MKPLCFKAIPIVFIFCLGLAVYSNTFHNSFHFDDYPELVNNASLKNVHDLRAIWNFWPTRFTANLSFALNYHWGNLNVAGYHIVSLLVHIGASFMAWWFVLLTLNSSLIKKEEITHQAGWIAFFTGLIFLLHPLQTQPINYIYQRSTLLAAFFYLSTLALYVKSRSRYLKDPAGVAWKMYFAGSLIAASLGMLSKETVISLPLMLCCYEYFFLKDPKKPSWPWITPFFLVALLLPLAWMSNHPEILKGTKQTVENYAGGITITQYLMTQPKVLVTYLKLLFIPIHQTVEYAFPLTQSLLEWPVILSIVFLLMILAGAVMLFRKYRLISFGIFWFFITLMPESSFWPNKDVIFEHRLYLPMMGFSLVVVSTLFYFSKGMKDSLIVRVLFLYILVLAGLAYQRNKVWENELTLWNDAVQQSPNSSRAHLNRGAAYQRIGNLDAALADYNMVIGLGPVDAVTLSNRGSIFREKGAYDLALANFNLAIQINSSYAGTYVNRGLLYEIERKYDLALDDFNTAIKLMPYNPQGYVNRAGVYAKERQYEKSLEDMRMAGKLQGQR